jgi:hypothetical protein
MSIQAHDNGNSGTATATLRNLNLHAGAYLSYMYDYVGGRKGWHASLKCLHRPSLWIGWAPQYDVEIVIDIHK